MNNFVPRDFIVAQGNAFFLLNNVVMAAPVLTEWGGEVEWTEAVEVERQDTEDTSVVDAIFLTLHIIASGNVTEPAVSPRWVTGPEIRAIKMGRGR